MNVALLALLLAVPVTPGVSRITHVTLYPDRAEVFREATVRVQAGASRVTLDGLPTSLDVESLRLSARGVPASLGALEVRTVVHEGEATPDLAAAEAEVRRVNAEFEALRLEEKTDADLRNYLDALRPPAPREAALQPGANALTAAEGHGRMVLFLGQAYGDLATRALARAARRDRLGAELLAASSRREAAGPGAATESLSAIVDVLADEAGSLVVTLAYVVPEARWWPVYRATLGPSRDEVELVSEALVSQQSGEDWSGIALELSTASPARGLESPILSSRFPWAVDAAARDISVAGGASAQAGYRYIGTYNNSISTDGGGALLDIPTGAIEGFKRLYAQHPGTESRFLDAAFQSDIQATFRLPTPADIPSDDVRHRVTLQRDTLPALFAYRIVPSVEPAAYALALTHAPEDRALLSGTVRVISGGTSIGSFDLVAIAPAGEFRVPLGIDSRIAVSRVVVPAPRGSGRSSGREQQSRFGFRTTLVNSRDVPVELVVEESLPESRDERLSVRLEDETTPGFERIEERPGVLNWRLTLAPKETRAIEFHYSVRLPRELTVVGL